MAGPPHSAPSCSCGQQTARNPRNKSQLRAAFSSGNNASCPGKKGNPSSPVHPAISKRFARRPIQGLVSTQHGTVLPVYSSSTYRDEGALSEIAIADYLFEQPPHSSTAEVRAGSAQRQLVTSSAPNVPKKVLPNQSSQSFAHCADACNCMTAYFAACCEMLAYLQATALQFIQPRTSGCSANPPGQLV